MTPRYCSDVRDRQVGIVRGLCGLTRGWACDMLFASSLRLRVVGLVSDLPLHDDGEAAPKDVPYQANHCYAATADDAL